MEHQKVLWIIFSVTLFLLVVVVVGFIWFLPPEDGGDDPLSRIAGRSESAVDQLDPIEWVRESAEVPGISAEAEETAESGDLLLVYGESEAVDGDDTMQALSHVQEREDVEAIDVTVRAQERSVARPTISVRSVRQSPPEQAVPKAAPPAPKNITVTLYWIQAGSFKSRSRAEETQSFLADQGWNTRIISRDVADDTFFRIRVGPYESEGEAEKFLKWIQGITTFENSYISQVYTTGLMN